MPGHFFGIQPVFRQRDTSVYNRTSPVFFKVNTKNLHAGFIGTDTCYNILMQSGT